VLDGRPGPRGHCGATPPVPLALAAGGRGGRGSPGGSAPRRWVLAGSGSGTWLSGSDEGRSTGWQRRWPPRGSSPAGISSAPRQGRSPRGALRCPDRHAGRAVVLLPRDATLLGLDPDDMQVEALVFAAKREGRRGRPVALAGRSFASAQGHPLPLKGGLRMGPGASPLRDPSGGRGERPIPDLSAWQR
jgi:hypothetical protein